MKECVIVHSGVHCVLITWLPSMSELDLNYCTVGNFQMVLTHTFRIMCHLIRCPVAIYFSVVLG